MAYSDKVVDHFNNPRNMGSFKKDEEGVGTGMVGAPECGDVMKLQIKVQNDTIVDAKFKTFGCGSAIASSSLATEWLKGKTVEEAAQIKNTDIVQEPISRRSRSTARSWRKTPSRPRWLITGRRPKLRYPQPKDKRSNTSCPTRSQYDEYSRYDHTSPCRYAQ